MDDTKRGLYGKYRVERVDGSSDRGSKHDDCFYFVLDTRHDKFAFPALLAYAKACQVEYPELAKDLEKLVIDAMSSYVAFGGT